MTDQPNVVPAQMAIGAITISIQMTTTLLSIMVSRGVIDNTVAAAFIDDAEDQALAATATTPFLHQAIAARFAQARELFHP